MILMYDTAGTTTSRRRDSSASRGGSQKARTAASHKGARAQSRALRPPGAQGRGSKLLAALGTDWMAHAKPGSQSALSASLTLSYGIIQAGVSFSGSLSRDDDRQYRLSGTLTIHGGAHAPLDGIGAYLDFGVTWSRTVAFKDYASYARWVQLQETKILQALASYGLSKGSKLTPAQRQALRRRVQADGHITAKGVKFALTGGLKSDGGTVTQFDASIAGSAKYSTYERRTKDGKRQRKMGVEKRVDLSYKHPPLEIKGFYQDMQGHANPDMDGQYVNISFTPMAGAKRERVSKTMAKTDLEKLKGALAGLGGRGTKNIKDIPRKVYERAVKLQFGPYGVELEWVVKPRGMFFRFARLFESLQASAGLGGQRFALGGKVEASKSSRRVIAEGLGTQTLNYVTQLHNGFARLGPRGMKQWEGWVRGHTKTLRDMYVAVGTPGTPAHAEAKDKAAGLVGPIVRAVQAKQVGKTLTSGQLRAISHLITTVSAAYRRDGDKQWRDVGGVNLTLTSIAGTPQFAKRSTVTSADMADHDLATLFAKRAADVHLTLQRSGRSYMDRGSPDYKRIADELGMNKKTTIEVRDAITSLQSDGAQDVAGGREAWVRYVSATGPNQVKERERHSAKWAEHLVKAVRQAPLTKTEAHVKKPKARG